MKQIINENAPTRELDESFLIRSVVVELRDGILFPGVSEVVIDPSIAGGQRASEDSVAVQQHAGIVAEQRVRVRRNGLPAVGGRVVCLGGSRPILLQANTAVFATNHNETGVADHVRSE